MNRRTQDSGTEYMEFLILGQGLAGTCLALRLAMEGRSFRILASGLRASASEKAAGLMNPVTGRRMALTWNYDKIWPLSISFYREAMNFLGIPDSRLFTTRSIRKALHSTEEINFLEAKSAWAGYQDIIRIEGLKPEEEPVFENLRGWAISESGARLDVAEFLSVARHYFVQNGYYLDQDFLKNELQETEQGWEWNKQQFNRVVSCLGLGCPWISPELWAVKGQIYILSGLENWGRDVLKTEHFLIPLDNGLVLAGSTYEREFEHFLPDETGLQTITGELTSKLKQQVRIEESWAGIRPTTVDRRPVIRKLGKNLFAINGLGSKGVSLAPYAANELLAMLQTEAE